MKADLIKDEIQEEIVRLYDIDNNTLACLASETARLSMSSNASFLINTKSDSQITHGIDCIDMISCDHKKMVIITGREVEWIMSKDEWLTVHQLTEAFGYVSEKRNRFQWLIENIQSGDGKNYSIILSESKDGLW